MKFIFIICISVFSITSFAQYFSYQESRTGEVACGGKYRSYHESRTGEVCCGGLYSGYHISQTGKVCAGGYFPNGKN
ncbi:hypothetical protein N9N67_01560 [Bacteriovoracaceae bacterium]|nr:hypothetical protein [Bacteriovoracaceae bacterium]